MNGFHSSETDQLFRMLLSLDSVEECYAVFEDLCTVKELKDMSLRLEVANLLNKGKTYQEISAATTISSATISRVNRCLNYGSGGYRLALNHMEETERKREEEPEEK